MYAGIGALSPQIATNAQQALPTCFSQHFSECWDDDNRHRPDCIQYEPLHVAWDADDAKTEALVDSLRFCDYSKDEVYLYGALAGGGGLLLGLIIASALSQ